MANNLTKRLRKIYAQASEELAGKVNSFFDNFERLDAQKRALVDAGKLTQKEYEKWRRNKLLMGQNYKDLQGNIASRMAEADKIAASYINRELPPAYTKGFNRLGKGAEKHMPGYAFSLISEDTVKRLATNDKTLLPYKFVNGKKAERWHTKRVNAQVLQGVLQGESSRKIADRLIQAIPEMSRESAMRNARTALTGATNHGRQDAMKRLQDDGAIIQKEWLAAVDTHTREAHLELNHVCVPIDEPFVNSIGEIMFPGDPDADPANVYNCRCSIATKIIGFRRRDEDG